MDRFLITLSLGPVQSLIGAARRTRDLWCGSWLLSEAVRAAAKKLHDRHPGCLIFPHLENPDENLAPQDGPVGTANIANILRAEIQLPNAAAARSLCDKAKDSAASRLAELGDQARRKLGRPVREEVWRAQIGDILEGFAAWVSFAAVADDYAKANGRIGEVLSARKATRNFQACEDLSVKGLPKSSLDGALETVLPDWAASETARRKLRLSKGEQLDALGLIKRLAGKSEQFTAYSRIAADAWIEQLSAAQQERLSAAYEPLVSLELATRTSGNKSIYGALPFDAQMLYESRLENELSQAQDQSEKEALSNLRQCIKRIVREQTDAGEPVGKPVHYAAILKADGDRMGAFLSHANSVNHARKVSRALHGFASRVPEIVRAYRGHAVYAGGDDVLALMPLVQAMDCSRKLATNFTDSLSEIAEEMKVAHEDRPTLSVGLGIGHFMDPLGTLRNRAERAEHLAKGDSTDAPRNALAIKLGIRSGAELRWRARWSDEGAFQALEQMIDAFRNGNLPTRAAYDLRDIDLRLAWLREDDSPLARDMRKAEVGRMLDRARIKGGLGRIPKDLQELIMQQAQLQPLKKLADTLIIARWLSARTEGDIGERT